MANDNMFTLPQQPVDVFETAQKTIMLWRKSLWSILPFNILPGLIISWPAFLNLELPFGKHYHHAGWYVTGFILAILSLIPYIGLFAKLANFAHGRLIKNSQAIAVGLTRLPSTLILILLMAALFFSVGAVALLLTMHLSSVGLKLLPVTIFILFSIIISVYFIGAFPLVISDNLSPLKALKSSFRLVSGHWWYIAAVIFLVSLVNIIPHLLAKLINQPFLTIVFNIIFISLKAATAIVLLDQLKLRAAADKLIQE